MVARWPEPVTEPPAYTDVSKRAGRVETRRLWVSSHLPAHGDWPHFAQACRILRRVQRPGQPPREEVAYAVTSLIVEQASPQRLLALWRQHWHIENRLPYVRDETLGEDRCQVRTGNAPLVLAGLRNTVISLLRMAEETNIAAALRRRAVRPEEALRLLFEPP